MGFRQLKEPNRNATRTPGWCLRYVYDAYGATGSARMANAQLAGDNEAKNGKMRQGGHGATSVPIWYSINSGQYKGLGHVAIENANGTVDDANGRWANRAALENYLRSMSIVYRGWSDWVGGVNVVEITPDAPAPDPAPAPTTAPKIGDKVKTSAQYDQNGSHLNLAIINDGQSVWTETNSKGNAVLRKDGVVRCGVPVSSLSKA